MHSLDERDQRERSQRPKDGVRAAHVYREEQNVLFVVAILGVMDNEKQIAEAFKMFYVYVNFPL